MHRRLFACLVVVIGLTCVGSGAGQNRIDVVTPAAPGLAAYSVHAVGVRTLQVVDRNGPDILNTNAGEPTAR